tara:strand:+ start:133 stop:735 length:603 start_codon:yes stop_codon:yes gene_type:complete
MAEKLNLVKEYKEYYTAKDSPKITEFGQISYLTIEGQGEPAGKAFTNVLEALYPLAYSIKKVYKNQGKDFAVPKLEGLWWVKSNKPALEVPRDEWYWKLLIRMPNFISKKIVEQAKKDVFNKKGLELIKKINLETLNEGKSVQIMHTGPYSKEQKTIQTIKDFIKQNNFTENGLHHEIYLSDPRKTKPEQLKTILRQPIK